MRCLVSLAPTFNTVADAATTDDACDTESAEDGAYLVSSVTRLAKTRSYHSASASESLSGLIIS